nr:lipocalin family protein [Thalassococcus arenae]
MLLATACAAPPPGALVPVTVPLRNPTAPIASQADATLARLQGDWVVVQGAGMTSGTRIAVDGGALRMAEVTLPLADSGRGRLTLGDQAVWVHWIDIDDRTAALGAPDGSRVWIMDRTGNPGERLRAAREILDWYGYDLKRMEGP